MNAKRLAEEWSRASDWDAPSQAAMPLEHYREWMTTRLTQEWTRKAKGPVTLTEAHRPPAGLATYPVPFELLVFDLPSGAKAIVTCGLGLRRQAGVPKFESWAHLEVIALVEEVHPLMIDILSLIAAKVHAHDGSQPVKSGSRFRLADEKVMGIAESRFLVTEESPISLMGGSDLTFVIVHPVREDEYEQAAVQGIMNWRVDTFGSNDLVKNHDVAPVYWSTIEVSGEDVRLPDGTEVVTDTTCEAMG